MCYFLLSNKNFCYLCTQVPALMPVWAGGWVGTYIYGKRLLDALFLTNQNFATSNSVKDKATVDAYGYVFADILCLCLSCSARWVWCIVWIVYMHISVGFCVARSDWVGNAKALICGTGNGYRLPRFSYPHVTICKHAELGEFIGDKTYKQLWKSIL